MVRICKSSFVKFSIFCRKHKITHSSSSSVITSSPEIKQPPNKRQRKPDYTPFIVLSTNSGKRNQSSEKKVLDNVMYVHPGLSNICSGNLCTDFVTSRDTFNFLNFLIGSELRTNDTFPEDISESPG